MTKKTRYFMLGSLAILVGGLSIGLVAYYGGLPPAFSKSIGPDEMKYVPADAVVVAYADVQQVMVSELRNRLRSVVPQDEEKGQKEFEQETGIKIDRDIQHVLACVRKQGDTEKTGFVLMRGTFDPVRLEQLAREHNGVVEDYHGTRVITGFHDDKESSEQSEANEEQKSERDAALAFIEPGLVAFGDATSVRKAIDNVSSGTSIYDNADLMRLVGQIEAASNVWAVGRMDVLANEARLPEGVAQQIPAIKWFSAAGRINGGVSGMIQAEARDEKSAENLRDVARGFLGLARLQAGSKPELQRLVDSLQLTGDGTTVMLSFSVPADLIEAFTAKPKPGAY